jgi:hypothetical protein
MSATHAALAARRAVVPARASASRRARRVSSRRGRATTTTTRAAVTEPATKITFEDALPSAVKDGASLTCVGAGVREKKIAIINVKVYAVALYVDADACKAALTTGATPLDGAFDKTLAIELARDVGGEMFWDALEDAVTPRIRRIATDMATKEDEDGNFMATVAEAAEVAEEAAMDGAESLKGLFAGENLKKGTRVTIAWRPNASDGGDVLCVSVGGGKSIASASEELALALFDVYLGDDPVSDAAFNAFTKGVAKLVAPF